MAEEIRELIRQYQGGKITRREFIRRAVVLTGSLAASHSLIEALADPRAYAGEVDPNDPALLCHDVEYAGRQRRFSAILPVLPHRENFPRSSSSMRIRG